MLEAEFGIELPKERTESVYKFTTDGLSFTLKGEAEVRHVPLRHTRTHTVTVCIPCLLFDRIGPCSASRSRRWRCRLVSIKWSGARCSSLPPPSLWPIIILHPERQSLR